MPACGCPRRSVRLAAVLLLSPIAACGEDAREAARAGGAAPPAAAARTASPTPAARPPAPDPVGEIGRLLDRRATALGRGDAAAYAATADGAQRRVDRRAARRSRALPLRDVELWADDVELDGTRRARARLVLSYGVRGIPGTYSAAPRLDLVRTESGWRVRRVVSARERPPWEVARYAVARSAHFVLLSPAALPPQDTGLLATLEAGYARTRSALPAGSLPRRTLVVLAGGPVAVRQLTRGIRGVEALAALADSDVREAGPARQVQRVLSQRLVLHWPRIAALGPDHRARVVAHELTHVALAGSTSGRTPAWLVEGLALWSSGDERLVDAGRLLAAPHTAGLVSRRDRRALTLRGLARPDAIAQLAGPAQSAAYAYASAAAHHIVARYGRRRFLRLYAAFDDPALRGDPGPGLSAAAVRRVLGEPVAEVERDLRRRARRAAGG